MVCAYVCVRVWLQCRTRGFNNPSVPIRTLVSGLEARNLSAMAEYRWVIGSVDSVSLMRQCRAPCSYRSTWFSSFEARLAKARDTSCWICGREDGERGADVTCRLGVVGGARLTRPKAVPQPRNPSPQYTHTSSTLSPYHPITLSP